MMSDCPTKTFEDSDVPSDTEAQPSFSVKNFVDLSIPFEDWIREKGVLTEDETQSEHYAKLIAIIESNSICTTPSDIVGVLESEHGFSTVMGFFSKDAVGDGWKMPLLNVATKIFNEIRDQQRECKRMKALKDEYDLKTAIARANKGKDKKPRNPASKLPDMSAQDIAKLFEDHGVTVPIIDLIADKVVFQKLFRDKDRHAGAPNLTPIRLLECAPLDGRQEHDSDDILEKFRRAIGQGGDGEPTIRSSSNKKAFSTITEWCQHWLVAAFAFAASGQVPLTDSLNHMFHCLKVYEENDLDSAVMYDTRVRTEATQLCGRNDGFKPGDFLSKYHAETVTRISQKVQASKAKKREIQQAKEWAKKKKPANNKKEGGSYGSGSWKNWNNNWNKDNEKKEN